MVLGEATVKVWTGDEIKGLVSNSPKAAIDALMTLYSYQTEDEKDILGSKYVNRRGFNKIDAGFASSIAEHLQSGNSISIKQLESIREMLMKYCGQLAEIANEREERKASSGKVEEAAQQVTAPELPKSVSLPSDFGFDPVKFPEYRPGQFEAAEKAAASDKKLFLVEAPTGIGKSLLALTAAKLRNAPRTVYLCNTKQLQEQLERDFHLPMLKGRNNYPCLHFPQLFPEVTSEICREYLGDEVCMFEFNCPYIAAKRAALSAPVCVLNYSLFLTEANYIGKFSQLDYLILDEMDTVEDQLMSFIEVSISKKLIERFQLGAPELKTKVESWVQWLSPIKEKLVKVLEKYGEMENLDITSLKEVIRLKRFLRKLTFLIEAVDENWVMEIDKDREAKVPITFRPVKVDAFAQEYLWQHASRALGMSATIIGPSAMAIDLGLKSWEAGSIKLDSPFPVESRRVNYIPVTSVTYKTKEQAYPKLVQATEEILKKHPDEKVLLHTVSYDLRNYFQMHLTLRHHAMFMHDRADRAIVLERFKSHQGPAVLISPSMERGVDLPGDLCRIVIVAKLPYPSLGSPQVNKRLHGFSDGSLWYSRRTTRSLVQMTGRATRFQGDWSVSYILDAQFAELVSRSGDLFPDWWRQACKYLDPKSLGL